MSHNDIKGREGDVIDWLSIESDTVYVYQPRGQPSGGVTLNRSLSLSLRRSHTRTRVRRVSRVRRGRRVSRERVDEPKSEGRMERMNDECRCVCSRLG